MASVNAIQFRGQEAVEAAYEANKVADWAMLCGKDILFQYTGGDLQEGLEQLNAWLDMLKVGRSVAQYQLRLYFDPKGPVASNTPFNQSFRFTLFADTDSNSIAGIYTTLLAKVKGLEDRLEEEEEPQEKGFIGMINGMMANPDIQQLLMQKIIGLVSGIFGNKSQPLGALAGIPTPAGGDDQPDNATTLYEKLSQSEKIAFDQAIEILLQNDPKIGSNLSKLAIILRDNPAKYQMYAAML